MFKKAISRATTNDLYASAAGLILPACRFEDPPLEAVVGAATRATAHVYRLLERKADAWPMREFAVVVSSVGQPGDVDGEHREEVAFVPGAARPAVGELLRSPFLEGFGVGQDTAADMRLVLETSGGLPLDWTACRSLGLELPHAALSPSFSAVVQAARLPPVPMEIAETFSPEALIGRGNRRPLGAKGAWDRVEQLEGYLGRDLLPKDLRFRLAEALAGGTMMRGSPPPWRRLVRNALERRIESAVGHPVVAHFVVASGQDRLAQRDDLVPGLLEAEDFRVVSCATDTP